MSGFLNTTGFAAPTSGSGFMSLLQLASWKGVPFHVQVATARKGRKQANHAYPFRDGGWDEDMGRAQRMFSFTGYLVGDLAPAMQLALDAAAESPGPGLLMHPTIGAVQCSLLSCATSIRKEAMRVIEVHFEFREQGEQLFPTVLFGAAISIISASTNAVDGCSASLGGVAGPAAQLGFQVTGQGEVVGQSFVAACIGEVEDASGLVSLPIGMVAPQGYSFGRFIGGHASASLQADASVVGLIEAASEKRDEVAAAGTKAAISIGGFSAPTAPDVASALSSVVETMRSTMADPSDQVRTLLNLAAFSISEVTSNSSIDDAIAVMRDAIAKVCRRVALISLSRASSSYLPHSYEDAASVRETIAAAMDAEITIAGDAGEDDAYSTLKALRSAVVADLTSRGASLPRVVNVRLRAILPTLTVAQILYRDASRSDEIVRETRAPHPAFCPTQFQALAAPGAPVMFAADLESGIASGFGFIRQPAITDITTIALPVDGGVGLFMLDQSLMDDPKAGLG